jgi:signal transduction histidine kinase
MAMVGAAAYTIGTLRARSRGEESLRAARALLLETSRLQADWAWESDASHRLLRWQGPAQAQSAHCALFDAAALGARLQSRQPFSGLRLRLAQAVDGSHTWELRGTPRHDDQGRFSGFAGAARPLDELESLRDAAAALPVLLAAHAGPAVLLADPGTGWQLQQLNAAAQALWPDVQPGTAAALPPALAQALSAAAGDGSGPKPLPGWQPLPYGPLHGGGRGLCLVRSAEVPAPVAAAAAEPAGESDAFSFTVSHDLRAPIRVVEGFTRIVKEDYGRLLDRVGNDHLDRVLGAAARMNLMIDALLTLARLSSQPLAHQPVNLSQLASYIVDDLRRAAPEREAEIEIQPDLVAQGDPTLLRLVLENLLGNAWKYSARTARTRISLLAVAHGAGRAYVVRDNGAGFDMRSADRLFGLFQRLHSASEFAGHGVGLASVRRIVRRHGGEIWAEAEPGRGAAFHFTLAA